MVGNILSRMSAVHNNDDSPLQCSFIHINYPLLIICLIFVRRITRNICHINFKLHIWIDHFELEYSILE
jgi:hypothetical protein